MFPFPLAGKTRRAVQSLLSMCSPTGEPVGVGEGLATQSLERSAPGKLDLRSPSTPKPPGSPSGATPVPTVGSGTGAGRELNRLVTARGARFWTDLEWSEAPLVLAAPLLLLEERNAGVVHRRAAVMDSKISRARRAYLGERLGECEVIFITPCAVW